MADYLLPDVGEGLTEAEIVSWKVEVGDVVAVNDVVVEIETAKSLVELPSPYAGTVTALLVPEGQTVPVGTPIIAIGDEAVTGPASTPPSAPEPAAEIIDTNVPPEGNPTLVGYGPREGAAKRRARRRPGTDAAGRITAHADVQDAFTPGGGTQHDRALELISSLITDAPSGAPADADADADADAEVPAETRAPRTLAKPPVRKLARDLGVDLAAVTPGGPNGTITRADVEAAASAATSSETTSSQTTSSQTGSSQTGSSEPGVGATVRHDVPLERERREPIKGVRKMMAEAMVSSAFSAPHVTEWVTIDVTRTMELVARLKLRPEFRDVKVSPLLVLARAVILAMRRTPEVNSSWDEAAQEVVYKGYVNLGIAAATPRGLVVPNVKEAQDLSLVDLARALNQLAATAREGRTQPAEMSGGTFTITNVGVFGIDSGTPIINPGESAILAFGAVRKQPWVVPTDTGDAIAVRQVTTLALSFDHRHIDGASGSRFLADVAAILEDPAAALLA